MDVLGFLSLVNGQLSRCLPFAPYEHCCCEHLCTGFEHLFSICFAYVPRRGTAESCWLLLADCAILHARLQSTKGIPVFLHLCQFLIDGIFAGGVGILFLPLSYPSQPRGVISVLFSQLDYPCYPRSDAGTEDSGFAGRGVNCFYLIEGGKKSVPNVLVHSGMYR